MNSKEIQLQIQASFRSRKRENFKLDVDLRIPGEGVTAIFGASGSGKTTLLRCIAGLERFDGNTVVINKDIWQQGKVFLPTHKRSLGYVFQESSLLPHLTAQGNLDYARKRTKQNNTPDAYQKIVSLMGIEHVLANFPDQLSGGERQRVAIAQALLINPALLLMDEPLASLDEARKREILPYLKRLKNNVDIPILYISHSIDEITRLADHLVVLEMGQVIAEGALCDVLSDISLPVQLGEDTGVVLEATVTERDRKWGLTQIKAGSADMWVKDTGEDIGEELRVRILARDVSITLESHENTSILNRLSAEIIEIAADTDNSMSLVKLNSGGNIILARITKRSVEQLKLKCGMNVRAQVKSVAVVH